MYEYTYIYWVNLEVVVLKIHSAFELQEKMLKLRSDYVEDKKIDVVNIYIKDYKDIDDIDYEPGTYREKIMEKGVYIGHHFGKKAKLHIKDKYNIYFCAEDYNRILWSYIVKYILTIFSLENDMLHLKAGLVEIAGRGILIVGRGGAGKTEMINYLCSCGAQFISNTHVICKGRTAYGIKSNVRVRQGEKVEEYVNIDKLIKLETRRRCDEICKVLWINHANDGRMLIEKLSKEQMYQNMKQFSEAIATWELHEDVYDFYMSNPQIISKKLNEADEMIKNITSTSELYYVNGDIKNEKSAQKLWDFLNNNTKK